MALKELLKKVEGFGTGNQLTLMSMVPIPVIILISFILLLEVLC